MIIDLSIIWSFLNEYVGYIVLFALGIFMYNEFRTNVSNLKSTYEDNLPSGYFPKLGMMGTTFGLILVFLNFDNGNIHDIIHGTGIAVLSTLLGLYFDVCYSRKVKKYQTYDNDESITGFLKNLITETKAVKSAIADVDSDSSLLSQIKLSRTENNDHLNSLEKSFKEFAETMAKNNTEALIEAIQEVMNNFNEKINDQLGETFMRLNSSVENLVKWQDQYKEHMEILADQINIAIDGIKSTENSLGRINESMNTLPESVDTIKSISEEIALITKEHHRQLDDLESNLSAFVEMKDKAVNAMPEIEENLKNMTEGLKDNVKHIMSNIESSSENLHESLSKHSKTITETVNEVKNNMISSTSHIEDSIKTSLDKIKDGVDGHQKVLIKNISDVTQIMQDSITNQQNRMEDLNTNIGKTLMKNANDVNKVIEDNLSNQQKTLNDITNDIAEKIKNCTTGMDTALSNALDTMNASIKKQQGSMDEMTKSVTDNIKSLSSELQTTIQNQLDSIRKSSEDLIKEAGKAIINIIDELDGNVEKLDAQMQQEITKALQLLTNKVTGFNEEFVKVHQGMINVIANGTNTINSKVNGRELS